MPRRSLVEVYMDLKEAGSVSDFPELLGNTMYKRLIDRFKGVPAAWRSIVEVVDLADFKPHDMVILSEVGDLEEQMSGEELIDTSISDNKWQLAAKTYELGFSINRKVIINDDLRAIQKTPQRFGRSAARTLAKKVVYILTNNPNCYDGVALFHANHSNLGSTALTANETGANAVIAAINAMKKQTDDSGERIGIIPKSLYTPTDLFPIANILCNEERIPNAAGNLVANPAYKLLIPVEDPYLTDVTDWYVFADPNDDFPAVQVGFLKGKDTPDLLVLAPTAVNLAGGNDDYEFFFDKLNYKARYDFGVVQGTWQGAYKSVVTG